MTKNVVRWAFMSRNWVVPSVHVRYPSGGHYAAGWRVTQHAAVPVSEMAFQ